MSVILLEYKLLKVKKFMNKKVLYSLLLMTMLVLIFAPQAIVLAQGAAAGGGGGGQIQMIVGTIARNLGGLGAGLATIAFIIAGITFLTATGNPSRMTLAKGALVAGVIGIVVILLADSACTFIQTFTGAGGTC